MHVAGVCGTLLKLHEVQRRQGVGIVVDETYTEETGRAQTHILEGDEERQTKETHCGQDPCQAMTASGCSSPEAGGESL